MIIQYNTITMQITVGR